MLTLFFSFLIFVRMLRHYSVFFLRFLAGHIKILSMPKKLLEKSKVLCQNYLSLASQNHVSTYFDWIYLLKTKDTINVILKHQSLGMFRHNFFFNCCAKNHTFLIWKTKTCLRNFLSFDRYPKLAIGSIAVVWTDKEGILVAHSAQALYLCQFL